MDTEIVLAAKNGDSAALEIILKQNYQQLYKTAFIYVKNEADALDIVQEAIIKIICKINSLTSPEYFTTWAVRVVIWTAVDFLRKTRIHEDITQETTISPETALSKADQLDIYEAIQRLPQHLQEITILHYFYGKKIKELAEVLEEPVGTIKYKLHESRKQLKNYLKEDEVHETK